jgi:cell division transport system permease protein
LSLARILSYFVREAVVSLLRSWKVSLLAIVTIAMSVFVGGTFLLLTGNLTRVIADWRSEARVVVYLDADISADESTLLLEEIEKAAWVGAVEQVSAEQAKRRFREVFPGVADLAEGWEEDPLPPSLELSFDAAGHRPDELESWIDSIREFPGVLMVDDDRDWLRQLEALVAVLRGLGLVVGAALLGAAVFTIASVIRLTAYLYRDEIAVMRMVGATELYIRGPFYFEGLIQGLAGGMLAVVGLYVGYVVVNPGGATPPMGMVVIDDFLSAGSLVLLLVLGGLAGLMGAVMSLRREDLGAEA